MASSSQSQSRSRRRLIARAFRLEWLTLGWLSVEAAIAIGSGIAAHSLSLFAFGLDSIIEFGSAAVLLWRLAVEIRRGQSFPERIERRAAQMGALLLFVLAGYVTAGAAWALVSRSAQQFSLPGLILTLVAIPTMLLLARAKYRIAEGIGSRALRTDAVEATACAWLSAVVVAGLVAEWAFGWWWIDGATALALVPFLVREAIEAWRADD
jgi:divalent metal cation (Fe/Co/Zn/Cd) transporter